MATQLLPDNLIKVSYILEKSDKPKLVEAAKKRGCSMSTLITETLVSADILPPRRMRRTKEA